MKRLTLLAIAVSSVASAQSTTCFVNGQWINCTTQPAPRFDTAPTNFGNVAPPAPSAEQLLLQQQQQQLLLQQQLQLEAQRRALGQQTRANAEVLARQVEVGAALEDARKARVRKAQAMIGAGHCDQAVNYLREMGDIALADDAVFICKQAGTP